jgi:hypothetical protein
MSPSQKPLILTFVQSNFNKKSKNSGLAPSGNIDLDLIMKRNTFSYSQSNPE